MAAGSLASDRLWRAERTESWSSGELRSNSARSSGGRSSIVMGARFGRGSSARTVMGRLWAKGLVSSASHDGADEKPRYWLAGTRQSGNRDFRLAVILTLNGNVDLQRQRKAPAIVEE